MNYILNLTKFCTIQYIASKGANVLLLLQNLVTMSYIYRAFS